MELRRFRYRLYPTREQEIMFAQTFGCVRFIYNKMLADSLEYYKEPGGRQKTDPRSIKKDSLG